MKIKRELLNIRNIINRKKFHEKFKKASGHFFRGNKLKTAFVIQFPKQIAALSS